MQQQKVQYRDGLRGKVKPEVTAAELERIKAENGALTAEAVFESARPKDAPLHPEFVWDAQEAIRQLGLMRAREIIRAVVVVHEQEAPTRIWVHVPDQEKPSGAGEYEHIEIVVQSVDLYERAVQDLERKFDAAAEALEELRRAAQGTDNADVADDIDAIDGQPLVLIRLAAIGLAVQGFGAVREALALLK